MTAFESLLDPCHSDQVKVNYFHVMVLTVNYLLRKKKKRTLNIKVTWTVKLFIFGFSSQQTTVPLYQKMWSFMTSHPEVFAEDNDDGIKRVRQSNGQYVYLIESTLNEYYSSRYVFFIIKFLCFLLMLFTKFLRFSLTCFY